MDKNEYMREYLMDYRNKERHKMAVYKSSAKRFVFEFATKQDMNELNRIFNER